MSTMKIKIVTAAVLSLLATSTFAAPTIYGEIDASVDYLPEKMQLNRIKMFGKLVQTVLLSA
jgi:predicted porin|tara:strand:+ start:1277 stop:1462 length:186 start_codon:yes stop_codon:yes gene_type:complete